MGVSTSAPTLAPMAPPTNSRLVNFAREFPGMRTSLRWSSILSRLATERQRAVLGGGPGTVFTAFTAWPLKTGFRKVKDEVLGGWSATRKLSRNGVRGGE